MTRNKIITLRSQAYEEVRPVSESFISADNEPSGYAPMSI